MLPGFDRSAATRPRHARRLRALALTAILSVVALAPAQAAPAGRPVSAADAQALHLLLGLVGEQYTNASPAHDATLARQARLIAQGARERVLELQAPLDAGTPSSASQPSSALQSGDAPRGTPLQQAARLLDRLTAMLQHTRVRLDPWPLSTDVQALSTRAQRTLDTLLAPRPAPPRPYKQIDSALDRAAAAARTGAGEDASFALLHAYALYAEGPGLRLQAQSPALDERLTNTLLGAGGSASSAAGVGQAASFERAISSARSDVDLVEQSLGEVQVSHATIVTNAAILVFREGLEAVLILAAITASFVGAKRHLRKPVLFGAFAGVVATAITWVVAQAILGFFGDGGLQLQAITGLLAIGVLLLVTNWFFHRVYWSEWISRFNRRRKALERFDGVGFISGQVIGFVLLGLTSVYREGFETVLFLQALQVSAGTSATLLGAGIGTAGTLLVGVVTFSMQRKLPYKRMLIVTGAMIALVLAVMVGTTLHNMQGIGWVPLTPTSFKTPLWMSTWLGVFPTWEGIAAQAGSLVFVVGSYYAAREIQVRRPQRLARARQAAATTQLS
ncbi:MAG TPA: FTR1 family protein [Solirubrobacteraceae bacterium]|nr:FTR1 family protein [Solirubrobacteraceae bacterium]